jgi:hypothetical protein
MNLQHVAALVREGGQKLSAGVLDDEVFHQVTGWLAQALEAHADTDIAQVLQLAREDSPVSERYASRAMRIVGGAQRIEVVEGQADWLHLMAIPVFIFPQQHADASIVLTHLECRAEIERSLEHALGLDYASLRLCDHPVSGIELERLDMAQARSAALDIFQHGTSPGLTPPVVEVGSSPEAAHHLSLLWPLVGKLTDAKRDEQAQQIAGSILRTQALATYKHRADELVEQELSKQWNLRVRADIYMPAFFHDAMTLFRQVELRLLLQRSLTQFKTQCHSVSFGIFANRLRYSLLDKEGTLLITEELWAPDETLSVVSATVRTACAKFGVACTALSSPGPNPLKQS